jgi:hypothetical protein
MKSIVDLNMCAPLVPKLWNNKYAHHLIKGFWMVEKQSEAPYGWEVLWLDHIQTSKHLS